MVRNARPPPLDVSEGSLDELTDDLEGLD